MQPKFFLKSYLINPSNMPIFKRNIVAPHWKMLRADLDGGYNNAEDDYSWLCDKFRSVTMR